MYFMPRSKNQHYSHTLWTLVLLDMYPRVVSKQGKWTTVGGNRFDTLPRCATMLIAFFLVKF